MQSAVEKEALINLRPGIMSPMNATIDYQSIATTIAMNTSSPPVTRVSECGMFTEHGELIWSVLNWRAGLRKLADEIHKELDELTLGQDFGLNIPNDANDDWANEERGYSWTERHAFLPDKRVLLAAMLAKPELKLAKLDDAGQLTFDRTAVWAFLTKCDALSEKIALLAFFTAGQTPRVSEFIEHKYANSTRPRTLFREGDAFWMATRRVKSETLVGKETFLPMKCHPELTRILERYLLIIRPVEAEMVKIVKDETQYHIYKEYLWTNRGKRVTPEQMRTSILNFNTNYCGVAAGTREYRQICVQMGRTFLGSEFEIKQEEMDTLAQQAGHSITIARMKYATEVGQIASMSTDLLLRFGRVSEAWWEHAGFKPGCPPLLPLRARQQLREAAFAAAQLQPAPAPAVDIQAIILAVIAAIIAEFQKLRGSVDTQIKQSVAQALPVAHHHPNIGQPPPPHHAPPTHFSLPSPPPLTSEDVQMINSDEEEEDGAPLTQGHPPVAPMDMTDSIYVEDEAGPEAAQASLHLHHTNLLTDPTTHEEAVSDSDKDLNALLALHSPHVSSPSFVSLEQKKAVRLAVEHRHSFVAVLPASDKGLIYTLPAFNSKDEASRHPSYIIVPSPSLLKDHVDHAKQLGIRYKQWSDKNIKVDPDKHRLVLLTTATAGSQKFKEYVYLFLTLTYYILINLGRLGIGLHMGSAPLVGFWTVQISSSQMHRFMAFTIWRRHSTLNGFSSWKLFPSDFRPAFLNRLVFPPIPTSSVHLAISHISAISSSQTAL